MDAEAGTHVVNYEDSADIVACLTNRFEKARRGKLGVVERLMTERRDDHTGHVVLVLLDDAFESANVVVLESEHVDALLGRDARKERRAPGADAVISALDNHDLVSARMGTSDAGGISGYVGPVLSEDGPVGDGHDAYEPLGEFDVARARQVAGVALLDLGAGRLLDFGMIVAEHHRSVGAHVVDVFIAVDVPEAGALGTFDEARRGAEHQEGGALMAGYSARYDLGGAVKKVVGLVEFSHERSLLKKGFRVQRYARCDVMTPRW